MVLKMRQFQLGSAAYGASKRIWVKKPSIDNSSVAQNGLKTYEQKIFFFQFFIQVKLAWYVAKLSPLLILKKKSRWKFTDLRKKKLILYIESMFFRHTCFKSEEKIRKTIFTQGIFTLKQLVAQLYRNLF